MSFANCRTHCNSSDWKLFLGALALVMLWVLVSFHSGAKAYGQVNELSDSEQSPVFFSQAQASKGGAAYFTHCASCHGEWLEGRGHAQSLIGTRFDQSWRGKPLEALSFHVRRMPPEAIDNPVFLTDETYTDITVFILSSNDFTSGDVDFPSDPDALKKLVIPQLEGMEYDPDAPVVPSAVQSQLLDKLPPVTDEKLQNSPPEDWLHWARTYNMHNFSPLEEIDKETVSELKLAWRLPLRNGGGNPSPLVHQGVMYLLTYPDTVLAIDATNGDVLWRYESKGNFQSTQKMGLALHGNKVLVPVSGLHVIALNAKIGELIWDHEIAHNHEGLQLRSAPLVAGGNVLQGTMGFYIP